MALGGGAGGPDSSACGMASGGSSCQDNHELDFCVLWNRLQLIKEQSALLTSSLSLLLSLGRRQASAYGHLP